MTIAYPYDPPSSPAPSRVGILPVESVGGSTSPFTLQTQVQRHQGQLWAFEVEMPPMQRAAAEEWICWRLALKGRYGTFLYGDPAGKTPRGAWTGTPVADSAGSPAGNLVGSEVLRVRGLANSVAGIVRAGDYVQAGTGSAARLYKVLRDADSDSSGKASLDIWPRLRATLADGAALQTSAAKGLFRMAGNEMPWDVGTARIYGLQFRIIEAT